MRRVQENGSIWYYDEYNRLTVEIPDRGGCEMDIQLTLPKTQRTYWSPETQTFVSYGRARQLGIDTNNEPIIHIKHK